MLITDLVTPENKHPTQRNYVLLPSQLIALQYYAAGTFHTVIVGDPLQVSETIVRRAIHKVSRALAGKVNDLLAKFLDRHDRRDIARI